MSEMNTSRRPPGASLHADVTGGILSAALEELAEVGYGKLSMDGVARRARAGKAALYRRWPAKQDMVLDAVVDASLPVAQFPSSGDIAVDIADVIRSVDAWISDPLMSRVLPDLLAEAKRNPGLAAALNERVGTTRRDFGRKMINAAIARGEVRPEIDVEYALDLMAGPIFWRVCGVRQETTPEFLHQVTATVLHALGLQPPAR